MAMHGTTVTRTIVFFMRQFFVTTGRDGKERF